MIQEWEKVAETTNYKKLALIEPEVAATFGIVTESPVFISPNLRTNQRCPSCEIEFGPLVYGHDRLVKAHHLHDFEGGIYFFTHRMPIFGEINSTGWIAQVEPNGKEYYTDSAGFTGSWSGRAESVKVGPIESFCTYPHVNSYHGEPLGVGLVYGHPRTLLKPVCEKAAEKSLVRKLIRYSFKIEEGHVLFSQV